jgi:hypothetical protein
LGLVSVAAAPSAFAAASASAAVAAPASTSAASEATAASSAATESTAPAAAASAALFARTGFIDGESAPAVLLSIQGGDGGLGFFIGAHFDEPEALASAGVAVVDDLRRHDGPVLTEQLLEFRAIDLIAEVPDI